MGYVDSAGGTLLNVQKRSAVLYSADGGVDYSTDPALIDDDKSGEIKNMWLSGGVLTSRPLISNIPCISDDKLSVNSYMEFCGYLIIHLGTRLYKLKDDESGILLENLPDKSSIPVEFSGKLYFYCDGEIFSVTRELSAEKELPEAPLYMTGVSGEYGGGLVSSKFKPNIIAPFVSATYGSSSIYSNRYHFPEKMNMDKEYRIYFNDKTLTEEDYTIVGDYFELNKLDKNAEDVLKISYYSTDESLDFSEKLSGCKTGTSFGGGTLDGTRVILAGNSKYPGRYFSSELANGLYFTEDSGGVIGTGTEDITAFSKQYGYLMIFTSHTVSRMDYTYGENGGYYTVKLINSEVGCDVPKSVQSVDNKTVFANSGAGIYIVDTTENYDELNIVPISKNITDSTKKRGWFSLNKAEVQKGTSCISGRKYMFLAGGRMFVLDYGEGVYTSSADYIKSAGRLKWFELEIEEADAVMTDRENIYFVCQSEHGGAGIFALNHQAGVVTDDLFVYTSKNTDLSLPHVKKTVTGFMCEFRATQKTRIKLILYGDGAEYYNESFDIIPDKDGYSRLSIKMPKYALTHFMFKIIPHGTSVGILNMKIDFMILKSNEKF